MRKSTTLFSISVSMILGLTLARAQAPKPPPVISPEVFPDRRITFRIYAPKAGEVLLTGDWMGPREKPLALSKSEDGVWSITAGPLEPNVYTYGYLIDGIRIIDAASPRTVVAAGRFAHSVVEVRGDTHRPWEQRPVPNGTIHIESFRSTLQQRQRTYYVYTPPRYRENVRARYPTLVLLPGTPGSEADWTEVGLAHRILDNLIADGQIKEMLVLMPQSDVLLKAGTRTDNLREFEPLLISEVLPHFENRYRVQNKPAARAIAGYSLGGELALTVGLRHPQVFQSVASFGGSIFEKEFNDRFGAALSHPKAINRSYRTIWIGCGAGDLLLPGNQKFIEALRANDIRHTFREVPGFHSTPTFRALLSEFLTALFR